MPSLDPGLVRAWSAVLALSKVTRNESVLLLLGRIAHPDNVQAARLAVAMLGASLVVMEVEPANSPGKSPFGGGLASNPVAYEALKRADFIIDMMGMDRGREQSEILASGARILLVKEPPETLMRLVPGLEDKQRVVQAADRLSKARTMRVSSPAGTSLLVEVGEYPCLVQYGFSDERGHWDHWPGSFVATWPNEGTANGTVVLSPGDVVLPFKEYVRSPVTMRIEQGYIRSIEGGLDARYLRDYIDKFSDPEGYAVSHLGWGLYPAAHWTALGLTDKRDTSGMESRAFSGNFMFSTGPNSEAGGTRHTPCHLDIPMMDCTVLVDDVPVVVSGSVATH